MVRRAALKLASIAGLTAVAFAAPAGATIYNTATQTLSYGPPSAVWAHTFSFRPFVDHGPGTTFNAVHLTITGTQMTRGGQVTCGLGHSGFGSGARSCTGSYSQRAKFRLSGSPLPPQTFSDLTATQTGTFNLLERNFFISPPALDNTAIPDTTTSATYNYYNTVVATGGSLNAAAFAGPGSIDFTFNAAALSELIAPVGPDVGLGGAAVHFSSLRDSLTVSLYYDYIDTAEPPALALFGVAALGLLLVRRRPKA